MFTCKSRTGCAPYTKIFVPTSNLCSRLWSIYITSIEFIRVAVYTLIFLFLETRVSKCVLNTVSFKIKLAPRFQSPAVFSSKHLSGVRLYPILYNTELPISHGEESPSSKRNVVKKVF